MDYAKWYDTAECRRVFELILAKPLLRLNPYRFSDDKLLEMAWQGYWGDEHDLTQMVVMTFTRIKETSSYPFYEGIYMRVGRSTDEILVARGRLINRITARDTLQPVRNFYGKRPIIHDEDVFRLVGRTVFVSRVIQGQEFRGCGRVAYRMHRLWNDTPQNRAKNAAIIREAMCQAKIEMLKRMLEMIERFTIAVPFWGVSMPGYRERVINAIQRIEAYPLTPVPKD